MDQGLAQGPERRSEQDDVLQQELARDRLVGLQPLQATARGEGGFGSTGE
jgi:dUTPase